MATRSPTDPLGGVSAMYRERFEPVADGVELRVLSWIPRRRSAARPVVMVPGWISVVEGWTDVLRRLAAERVVVYVETREKRSARFGRRPRVDDFRVGTFAHDLRTVVGTLEVDVGDTVLLASSLGSNAVLEALKGGGLSPAAAFLIGPNTRFHVPWWGHLLLRAPAAAYPLVREPVIWYLRRFRVNAEQDPEQMARYERTLRDVDALRLKLSARALVGYRATPGLETIRCPVAIAYADIDTLHGRDEACALAERIPDGTAVRCRSNTAMHRAEVVEVMNGYLEQARCD